MTIAVWSVKGGVGVTSVAAMLAIAQVERAEPAVLIDLCGDLPALLGTSDVDKAESAPGVVDWCAAVDPMPDALARIELAIRHDLTMVPRGAGSFPDDATPLLRVLGQSQRHMIVDCGRVAEADTFCQQLVRDAPVNLLVVRECFLNLRAVQRSALQPTGVVVLNEPGRHLGRPDVEAVAGAPVVAQIAIDAGIARSLDAGLAGARLSRRLLRTLARVPDETRQLQRVGGASHVQ